LEECRESREIYYKLFRHIAFLLSIFGEPVPENHNLTPRLKSTHGDPHPLIFSVTVTVTVSVTVSFSEPPVICGTGMIVRTALPGPPPTAFVVDEDVRVESGCGGAGG
jgi:hypothetical protein